MDLMTDQPAIPPVPGVVDLHARLAAGETLYGAFAGLGSPVATEIMARSGFDWLLLDLEHGAGTESDLLASLHAMGATPAAALVRPQSGERLRIGRALDLGAHGIMVPRVDLPEQAREAISFMRYPPDRPVAQPRHPGALRRRGLRGCPPPCGHDGRGGREGRRDPATRRVVAGP